MRNQWEKANVKYGTEDWNWEGIRESIFNIRT